MEWTAGKFVVFALAVAALIASPAWGQATLSGGGGEGTGVEVSGGRGNRKGPRGGVP